MCRNADARTLVGALIQESDESSRQAILQSLFARRDGMDRYLDLVLNASTRRVAIESLQTAPGESRQMLLTALDGPSIQRRFAAAQALGSICGGDTLPVLRSMIQRGDHTREALAVLSECDDSAATDFVKEIRREPGLATQFAAVRSQMQQLF